MIAFTPPSGLVSDASYQVAIGTLLVVVLLGFAIHLFTPNIRRVRDRATPMPGK